MKRKVIIFFLVNAIIAGIFALAYGSSGYLSDFRATYPSTTLNSCTVCHTSPPTLNPYGQAWLDSGYNFAAIQTLDSDGDGFSNIAEIQAGTYPGNAASKPAASDTTPPTVTGFTIPATSTSLTVAITTLTATDNVAVTGYIVTETATAPAAAAAGWTAAAPASYTFTTAGAKTVFAWAKDAAGNVSTSLSAPVTIALPDATPPTVTGFSIPATSTSLVVSITTFTATDNVAVTGYIVTEAATAPAAGAAGWSSAAPANYNFTTAGAKTLYAWVKDAAGNVSTSLSASVTITLADTTPPTVTGFTIPATAASLTVSITAFTATDNVAVAGYIVTETATAPTAAAAGWTAAGPASFTFTTAGAKTLYAWAKDAAGNVSTSRSAPVTITLTGGTNVPAIVGIYRNGAWYFDQDASGAWGGCTIDTCIQAFGGLAGDIPVMGDWTGDGVIKIGIYRQGQWYLDKNANGLWDGCSVDSCLGPFGGFGVDIPVVGDWTGDGIAKIGIYRQGQWYMDKNANGLWDGCSVDSCLGPFGGFGVDIPVVGDWTGDGIAKIGIYRQGQWYLDKSANGTWDDCTGDTCIQSFGGYSNDKPVIK
jgi:hypothetical protein